MGEIDSRKNAWCQKLFIAFSRNPSSSRRSRETLFPLGSILEGNHAPSRADMSRLMDEMTIADSPFSQLIFFLLEDCSRTSTVADAWESKFSPKPVSLHPNWSPHSYESFRRSSTWLQSNARPPRCFTVTVEQQDWDGFVPGRFLVTIHRAGTGCPGRHHLLEVSAECTQEDSRSVQAGLAVRFPCSSDDRAVG